MKTMNKFLLATLIFIGLMSPIYAQIPDEAFPLTNSLDDLWKSGKIDTAVENAQKLYRLYPPFFRDNIHNKLVYDVKDDKKNSREFLEKLFQQNNAEINTTIKPIYYYSIVVHSSAVDELIDSKEKVFGMLSDTANYFSKAERYALMAMQSLEEKEAIDDEYKEKLLQKVIQNLETFPYKKETTTSKNLMRQRAWHRYMLAFSYNALYHIDAKEDYLRKASEYCPDLSDKRNSDTYMYDAWNLTNNNENFAYKINYLHYLKEQKRDDETLALLTEIAFETPNDYNLSELKGFYKTHKMNLDFVEYWREYINTHAEPVPKIQVSFGDEVLDLTQNRKHWSFIDVWGTWCSPCVAQLPELQEFYIENEQDEQSNVKMYSFSYYSNDLSKFMEEHQYTFPVSEIDKSINDQFLISSYPTKLLISPEGYYVKIPFAVGADWKEWMKNYALTE